MSWEDKAGIHRRSAKPRVRGTRNAYDVLEYLAGGMSVDEILEQFSELTREDIQAVLQSAAARQRRLAASPQGSYRWKRVFRGASCAISTSVSRVLIMSQTSVS